MTRNRNAHAAGSRDSALGRKSFRGDRSEDSGSSSTRREPSSDRQQTHSRRVVPISVSTGEVCSEYDPEFCADLDHASCHAGGEALIGDATVSTPAARGACPYLRGRHDN